jgi:hypothetical protein
MPTETAFFARPTSVQFCLNFYRQVPFHNESNLITGMPRLAPKKSGFSTGGEHHI